MKRDGLFATITCIDDPAWDWNRYKEIQFSSGRSLEKTAVARLGSGIAGKNNPRLVVMAGKDLKDGVSEARSSRARSWADSLTSFAAGLVASLLAALITGGIASTSALKNLGIASAALITVTLASAATGVGLALRARRRPTVDSAHAEQLRNLQARALGHIGRMQVERGGWVPNSRRPPRDDS